MTKPRLQSPEELGFDPDALRNKYREERDKRLREDGNKQYVEVKGDFSRYIDDPYVETHSRREAAIEDADIVIIGGGFGGLITGARLREAGFEDIRIIEKGGDFGGTWYWNRYPGAACDTESYVYLPLLEELNFMPTHKYVYAVEIRQHACNIAKHYDLYRGACLQTQVESLVWNEASARWIVSTDMGDRLRARFVVMSNGPLNRPKLPGIPGIDRFQGHTFHTSRWDYAYTGGDADGDLSNLSDKRVGIIGTGATAVQCIPHLGASAEALYVFQRTPSSIDVRNNRPTDPEWAAALSPGWHRERLENFNTLTSGGIVEEDLVKDGWTEIIRNLISMANYRGTDTPREMVPQLMELADFEKMEQIRARVDQIVEDPETASKLKPWYRQFCKRPCFHDAYLPTFNRSNVHLIDTEGRGVEAMTERGIVANGVEYELDCIIFATGFEVGTEFSRRVGYDTIGRDGLRLSEKWADGVRTLHGLHSRGFPNLLIMSNAQAAFTTAFTHAMDESAKHMAYILRRCFDRDINTIEPTEEAENSWVEEVVSVSRFNEDFLASCTPGYYNNEGQPDRRSIQNGSYGRGPNPFFRKMAAWREADRFDGLSCS